MSKKKEWVSPAIHPNSGTVARGWFQNKETGTNLYREVLWNRTHWTMWHPTAKEYVPIPAELELVGWSL